MTDLTLIKNGDGDWRLRKSDGTTLGAWTGRPGTPDMAAATDTRRELANVVTGDLVFRDVTISDEVAPGDIPDGPDPADPPDPSAPADPPDPPDTS